MKITKIVLYACYVNDTQAIVERAKTASKAQLDKNLNISAHPFLSVQRICNALKYAEIEYNKYTDSDNKLKEIYNMLKSDAENQ